MFLLLHQFTPLALGISSCKTAETPENVVNVFLAPEVEVDFARLSALLTHLEARERELVALKYGAGLTNRAIAELTGLSESNVGTILHRVVTRLRAESKPTIHTTSATFTAPLSGPF